MQSLRGPEEHVSVTKTRLMGVVAAYLVYGEPPRHEFFHVEFESYGLDRFEVLEAPGQVAVDHMKAEIFGGLGGPLVPVPHTQLMQLLVAAYAVNPRSEYWTQVFDGERGSRWVQAQLQPHLQAQLQPHLQAQLQHQPQALEPQHLSQCFDGREFLALMDACCEELRSPFEYLHYFLMRYLGQDDIYLRFAPQGYPYLAQRYSLMRNHLQRQDDDSYRFSALVLAEDYALIEGEVYVEEGIVERFEVQTEKPLTQLEASLLLKKPEYIYLYDVDEDVEGQLASANKAFAVTLYAQGSLYIAYRAHNDHVNAKTFYLNGDVEVFFYFTDSHQLLLVGDDLRSLIKWDDYLQQRFGDQVQKYEEWDFDTSVLYDFIDSPYVDFDDYIKSET